jgi:hypothetical protein
LVAIAQTEDTHMDTAETKDLEPFMVPAWRLMQEKQKRKEAEREIAELQAKINALLAEPLLP